MKKKIKPLKVLLFLLYLILTGTSLMMIYGMLIISPFDFDYPFWHPGEMAINGEFVALAWLVFAYNAIKNIIVGLIAGYFNKRLMILSLVLGIACLMNFLGTFYFLLQEGH